MIHVEASHVIEAPAGDIYAVLSDYREGHPAVLPKPYFTELVVEEGGIGAGTVVRVGLSVMGVKRTYRLVVSEPEPGHILMEADSEAGVTTTFTVEPLDDGSHSRVTIASDSKASPGFAGWMEKLMNPPITRRIYKQELEQLAGYMRSKRISTSVN